MSGEVLALAERCELLALAERCEKAAGPDRKLDALIASAVGRAVMETIYHKLRDRFGKSNEMEKVVDSSAPAYTASLDAAMSLVPEGMWAEIGANVTYGTARLSGTIDQECYNEFASCSTPTLALCSAALRARAAS